MIFSATCEFSSAAVVASAFHRLSKMLRRRKDEETADIIGISALVRSLIEPFEKSAPRLRAVMILSVSSKSYGIDVSASVIIMGRSCTGIFIFSAAEAGLLLRL